MEYINKPDFNQYNVPVDAASLKETAQTSFVQLKNMKGQMISTLRQLSTLKSYDDRKTEQVDRFQQKSTDIKNSKDSWVSTKTGQIIDLEREVRDTYIEYKAIKASLELELTYAENHNEISNKDKNAVELYLSFMDDFLQFFDNNIDAFKDGRLSALAEQNDGWQEEWNKYINLFEGRSYQMMSNCLEWYNLLQERQLRVREWNKYQLSANQLIDNYLQRNSAISTAMQTASGTDLDTLVAIATDLDTKIADSQAELAAAQIEFGSYIGYMDSRIGKFETQYMEIASQLDMITSDFFNNAMLTDAQVKENHSTNKQIMRNTSFAQAAKGIGMPYSDYLASALDEKFEILNEFYNSEKGYEDIMSKFNNATLTFSTDGYPSFSLDLIKSAVATFGSLRSEITLLNHLKDNILPSALNKYSDLVNERRTLAGEYAANLVLKNSADVQIQSKYAEILTFDPLSSDYANQINAAYAEALSLVDQYYDAKRYTDTWPTLDWTTGQRLVKAWNVITAIIDLMGTLSSNISTNGASVGNVVNTVTTIDITNPGSGAQIFGMYVDELTLSMIDISKSALSGYTEATFALGREIATYPINALESASMPSWYNTIS